MPMGPSEDEDDLRRLNERFVEEENAGRGAFFEGRLAPEFAFRRADEQIVSREKFLKDLKPGGVRTCDPRSIEVHRLGCVRSLVTCVVAEGPKSFQNARLFVKDAVEGRWKLLGWANEEGASVVAGPSGEQRA